ncbi:hypothetical protein CU098_008869 [Rhizopus stolonifer]|uniref:Uncharacterized protein n=1 Tax=Rhizopus stolonifer TaxID=4846 RepID=A0A367KS71_RHIST|nr:hypothetical protein CU098_008869 [Rhizopus stolonifer]
MNIILIIAQLSLGNVTMETWGYTDEIRSQRLKCRCFDQMALDTMDETMQNDKIKKKMNDIKQKLARLVQYQPKQENVPTAIFQKKQRELAS